MMLFNRLMQDGIVARKQFWHLVGMLLREFCAAFDTGKEEGDGSGGELIMVSHLKH
jgi:hypothetical protein